MLRAMRSGGESSAVRLLLLDTCALSTVLRFLSIMYNNTVVLNTENLLPCLFHINLLQSHTISLHDFFPVNETRNFDGITIFVRLFLQDYADVSLGQNGQTASTGPALVC